MVRSRGFQERPTEGARTDGERSRRAHSDGEADSGPSGSSDAAHDETSRVINQSMSQQLLEAIDRTVETRWEAARQRATDLPGDGRDERVDALTEAIRRELGLAGAAAGGAAAVPGIGLAGTSAAFVVELGWSTMRLADLILTIAAIHGHDRATVDERRLWVLSILTYRDGAATVVTKLADDLADQRSEAQKVSRRSLRRMNAFMGRAIVSKYGARRGVAALGRAVPFGVGAILGYGINSRTVATTARHAHDFFTNFPIAIDVIDVDATTVTGRLAPPTA